VFKKKEDVALWDMI